MNTSSLAKAVLLFALPFGIIMPFIVALVSVVVFEEELNRVFYDNFLNGSKLSLGVLIYFVLGVLLGLYKIKFSKSS